MPENSPGVENVEAKDPKRPDPCQTVGQMVMQLFQLVIQVFSIIFTSDNLVILCLTVIAIYCVHTFGASGASTTEKIVIGITGGMIGYLGGQVKKALTNQ